MVYRKCGHTQNKETLVLSQTRGTDITEAFETMHVFSVSDRLLNKYYVRPASTPRKYRYRLSHVPKM